MMADFTDLFSQYVGNRVNKDMNRVGMGNNGEDNTQANVTPTSTTINYNDDGSHDITHKMNVAPVNPDEQPSPIPQPAPAPSPIPQPAPVTGPVAPPAITPTPGANQILNQAPMAGPAIPQAAPQVPSPGVAQMNPQMPTAPVAPPLAGQAQIAQAPAPQLAPAPSIPQPMIAGNPSTDIGQTPTEQAIAQQSKIPTPPQVHEANLVNWQDDPRKVALIASDKRTEEEGGPSNHVKQMANNFMLEHYKDIQGKNEADKRAQKLLETNDTKGIARELQKNDSEGSYLKAYLYHRLGMSQLAQQEQIKLGAGSTMQRITLPDNTTAIVRMRGDGVASYGVDTTTGKQLDADQLALATAGYAKGTETGKTMYKTRDGHVITMATVPGRVEPVFYDNTEKKILSNAPLGLTPIGQKDSMIEAGMAAKKQVETAARKDNNKAGGSLYTEQQIQQLGNDSFKSIVGYSYNAREHGVVSPVEEARQGEPGAPSQAQQNLSAGGQQVGGQGEFSDPSIRVISAQRPTSQQQGMWDESVAAGRPGITAQGNPIAKPGTSLHETDNARDIDSAKLTKAGRQELYQKGWYQPIPQQDPNHWERIGAPPAKETPLANNAPTGAKTGVAQNIDTQAQAIANYQSKPATAGGAQGPYNQAVMARVRQINPDYDESKWDTAKKTRQAFTTGKQGDTVRSMNVAVDHLDTLHEAATALNNGELPLFNKIANDYSRNTGSPVVTNFDGIKSIVGSEVAKAVAGSGGSALGDREEIRKEIDATNSYKQLAGVIKKYQQLMAGQIVGLKTQYNESGLKDFDAKLTPRTKQIMGNIEREKKNTRSNW